MVHKYEGPTILFLRKGSDAATSSVSLMASFIALDYFGHNDLFYLLSTNGKSRGKDIKK